MQLLEIANDHALIGFGLLTYHGDFKSRSLLAIFFQKENRELLIDLLYFNIILKVS